MLRIFLIAGTVLAAQPLLAQSGPSFDCSLAQSSAEKAICADPELAELDQRLSKEYARALVMAQELDYGADEAIDELRATQRGWISGRDECWKAADQAECISDAYLRREGELVAQWFLEEPASVVTWICDENPSNELVTIFFGTELPSVRFERGDRVTVGSLAPTGSGARYDGPFGQFLWMKGNEAIFREADPDGTEYRCREAS